MKQGSRNRMWADTEWVTDVEGGSPEIGGRQISDIAGKHQTE